MSQIFDALQRSEAERAGSPLETPLEPNDMLRRAERQIASKWESQSVLGGSESVAVEEMSSDRPQPIFDSLASGSSAAGVANSSKHDDRLRILGQFQTLQLSLSPESRLVALTEQDSPAAEAFRLLGVRLRDLSRTRPLKKVLITSTIPQEGKTTVAANLAFTLARSTQQKILLLEGDVRRPALSQMFGLQGNPGICEWLRGDHKLTACVYYLEGPGIWIMPAGSSPQNPLEVLQSVKLNALMAQLADWFDCIVIDSPPVLPLADTSVWMRLADGIILVARQGTTEKKQLQRGLEAIEPQKLVGALLNCSTNKANSHYYY
jgi:capsular exopolysaccharide synthesis family protein